jgi:hypothetical protein
MEPGRTLVASHVRGQRDGCARLGSPLYAGLLDRVASDVVLTGQAPVLESHYASGGDPDDAWNPFRELFEERGDEVRELALRRPVQTNEVGRCAALAPALLALSHGMPLRLLEPGASAGLNLLFDFYRYEELWGDPSSPVRLVDRYVGAPPPFEPAGVEVVERRGCDRNPVDAASDDGRLTLLSYVWPDQVERVDLLRGALEVAGRVPPVTLDRAPAADWTEVALSAPAPPGVATVLFHSIMWQYLSEDERAQVTASVELAGARATRDAPLAWLRMEPDGQATRLDATVWPGGEHRLIARAGYHGRPVRWLR